MFAAATSLVRAVLANWRPPPPYTLSEWADARYYLSAESSAEAGRWHTIPYQREPMDAITDPMVERVSFMKSARVGYTKMVNATIGYHIDHDPCPIMVVQPTLEDAEGYSKEEIAPMLRDTPCLRGKVEDSKAKGSGNTIKQKVFKGGVLGIVGANSPTGFRRVSRRVLLMDEVDGYPASAGAEGDPVSLAEKRTEYYWNRKIIQGSTPTIAEFSRIEKAYQAGDQRRYYVPCPECGTYQYLKFSQFKWPSDWKKKDDAMAAPHLVNYECENGDCKAHISHDHKRAMVEAGEWRASAPFNGHASFHIWAAYSYSPNATWAHIVGEFLEANSAGVEKLKTFINTALGETWKDRGEAPEWQRLYDRRESYTVGTIPRGGLFLTCGVDVQKDRLVWEVVAWGRGKRSWSVDKGVLTGDTSTEAPWGKLNEMLVSVWRHDSGLDMRLNMMCVDSGYNTQNVYDWCRQHPMDRVRAIKGTSGAQMILGTPSAVDVNMRGKKMRRAYKVWPAGVDIVKSELYGWFRLEKPTDESGAPYPPGYCHFPMYDEEFFKQITAEQLVPHRNRKGFIRREWELIPGRENHYLDCRVYARVAANACGIDRMTPDNWTELETRLGLHPDLIQPPPQEDAEETEAEAPEQPASLPQTPAPAIPEQPAILAPQLTRPVPPPYPAKPAPAPPQVKKPPWIGERRKGWITRDRN